MHTVEGPWLAVVEVWEAAAGAADAYVPPRVLALLREAPETPLDDAVRIALGQAAAYARDDGGACAPRGCEVEYAIRDSVVVAQAIIWRTSVVTTLYRPWRGAHGDLVGRAHIPEHAERRARAQRTAERLGLVMEDREHY